MTRTLSGVGPSAGSVGSYPGEASLRGILHPRLRCDQCMTRALESSRPPSHPPFPSPFPSPASSSSPLIPIPLILPSVPIFFHPSLLPLLPSPSLPPSFPSTHPSTHPPTHPHSRLSFLFQSLPPSPPLSLPTCLPPSSLALSIVPRSLAPFLPPRSPPFSLPP